MAEITERTERVRERESSHIHANHRGYRTARLTIRLWKQPPNKTERERSLLSRRQAETDNRKAISRVTHTPSSRSHFTLRTLHIRPIHYTTYQR